MRLQMIILALLAFLSVTITGRPVRHVSSIGDEDDVMERDISRRGKPVYCMPIPPYMFLPECQD